MSPMYIALVAGELSGDRLGAGLITALKNHYPDAQYVGIGGPQMRACGFYSLFPMEKLSVMGLVEVLWHLPELWLLQRDLYRRLLAYHPAVFIGIDAPDFNLPLAASLHQHGIPTVHYVSPSVWAWRPARIHKIARAIDRMLTLFPFETEIYQQHGIAAHFVGHPLADALPDHTDGREARARLHLSTDDATPVVALLPGSRQQEVRRLAPLFLQAAYRVHVRQPLRVLIPAATPPLHALLMQEMTRHSRELPVQIIAGQSLTVMAAADVVLAACGTATLEAMLLKRPLIAAYRLAPLTAWIVSRLIRIQRFALPNLLAHQAIVPEFIQQDATAAALSDALATLLNDPVARNAQLTHFASIHQQLRRHANDQAAAVIQALLMSPPLRPPPAGGRSEGGSPT